ncbi:MAG: tetratricopeptide repeat protein [Candidatus Hydrogenedentes bacterium]|nr:tetratricopeptide repeat protein [Candidatus Hydrogenedentota bacterium]
MVAKKNNNNPSLKEDHIAQGKSGRSREIAALIAIVVIGLAVYGRCVTYEHVLYDDPNIIFDNPHINSGLSIENIGWAFTTPNFGLYSPLPGMTFMLDSNLFGDWAGGFHFMTMAWHLLCACTLFIVLLRLLRNFPVALLTALLFTVHPVQAMTVNWIQARNVIMPAFFLLLSIEAYRRFTEDRSWKACAASLCFMLLAFLSKQGSVLLPAVLLMLDYWPLRRLRIDLRNIAETVRRAIGLILEKIPWMAMSGVGIFLAFVGKNQFDVLDKNAITSPLNNLGFSFTAYIRYLFHLLYPVNYITSYSRISEDISLWMMLAAFVVLILITCLLLFFYARRPYLIVGWTWFVLLLLPLSGLLRYNFESIALRYVYTPAIGLYLLTAFLLYEVFLPGAANAEAGEHEGDVAPMGFKITAVVLVGVLVVLCFWQSGFWRDTKTLAQRAVAVTDNTNAIAQNHLGHIATEQGRIRLAEVHFREAMKIEPGVHAHIYNYAAALIRQQRYQDALNILDTILKESMDFSSITSQYGAALVGLERYEEADKYLERALEIGPDCVPALFNLALSLYRQHKNEEVIPLLKHVLEVQPSHKKARVLLDLLKETGY